MPNSLCSHNDNRKKVCGPCGRKIVFGKNKPEKFLISKRIEDLIKKFISENFDLTNEKYPLSICMSCYLTLIENEKEIFNRQLPNMPNYEDIILAKETRSSKGECDCYVCSTAKFKGHVKVKKGRGKFRDLNAEIDISSGFYESKISEKVPLTPHNNFAHSITLCTKCFQEIGRGKKHECKSFRDNVIKIVEKLPEKIQEQIVSRVIKNKADSNTDITGKFVNVDLNVSTSGRSARITVNKIEKDKVSFNEDSLDNFRVKLGASSNQMKKITNFLRCNVGRMSVPANYSKHMSDKSNLLKDVYKTGFYEFECENAAEKQLRPVVYADAEELLDRIIENRNLIGNIAIKVMADGGQNFFKISLTILEENYSPKIAEDDAMQQEYNDENDSQNSEDLSKIGKRKLYSEGGSLSKKGKMTSVDKLILLCVVPGIKESHANMKVLFELTKINNIPFKFVADFKLLLIVNGQQTATSMFPCPYCFISLHDLRGLSTSQTNFDDNSSTSSSNNAQKDNLKILKTYGDLRKDYNKYCLTGKNKKYTMECHSTINLPLFEEADDVCVLQKCVVPELHVLQGFVNHLFWKGLVILLGKEKALLWPKKLNLISKNYHGDAFEGNACRKLLTEADKLEDPELYKDVGIFKIMPYIAAFKAMNKIVKCCFTSGKVGPSLDAHINELEKALKSIDKLSETLKIHVILSHVKESLQYIEGNNGLGFWSEQSGESVHRDFLKFWARYKVNSFHHDSYLPNLLKAVVEFSSLHI